MTQRRKRPAPRLRFSDEERAQPSLAKPIAHAERAADKRDAAKRKIMKRTVMQQSRLRFDDEQVKKPSQLHHAPSHAAADGLHRQMERTNEDENVGAQAALQGEQVSRSAVRLGESAHHARELKHFRDVEKAEQRLDKANLRYLDAKRQQEQSHTASHPLSRLQQKRAIRREYAAMRSGKSNASGQPTVKTARSAIRKRKAASAARRPKPKMALLGALGLMLVFVLNGVSSCMPLTQTVVNSFVIGTYPAAEEDVKAAERAYAAKENALQNEIDNYAAHHPGYDEYHVDAQEIWHDPYALIAIISAYYDGEEWTINEAYPVIEKYFQLQYILTEEIVEETRYRTEQRTGQREVTDPVTGETVWESYEYDVQVPYTYRICNVKLENKILSHLPVYSMSHHTMGMYALYMASLGNMPDLFAGNPHASTLRDPMIYDIPEEVLQADPQFAALMEEANKYVGYPYVWGGDSPETSFDCSGFVSYVFTNSGVYNTGRLGATGLYGACHKLSPEQAQPGDLIFFEGTMGEDVGGITHVGIYVGDNKMIHCGNPIGYADLTESYWQHHFYGYGRLGG